MAYTKTKDISIYKRVLLGGSNIKGPVSEMIFQLPFAFGNFVLAIPFNFN